MTSAKGWTKIGFALAGAVVFVWVRFLLLEDDQFLPQSHEWPQVLAPIITFAVCCSMMAEVILYGLSSSEGDYDHYSGAISLLLVFITLIVCLALATVHAWDDHLWWLFTMFVFFCIWDWLILYRKALPEEYLEEINKGHRYINIPTVITVLIVLTLLKIVEDDAIWAQKLSEGGFSTPIDAFTSGLIAFHLGVAAISYVAVTTRVVDFLHGLVGRSAD